MAFRSSCEFIGPTQSVCWLPRTPPQRKGGGRGERLLVAMVGNAGGRVAFGGVAIGKRTVDNMLTSHASAAIAQGSGMCSNKARRSNIMNRNAFL